VPQKIYYNFGAVSFAAYLPAIFSVAVFLFFSLLEILLPTTDAPGAASGAGLTAIGGQVPLNFNSN